MDLEIFIFIFQENGTNLNIFHICLRIFLCIHKWGANNRKANRFYPRGLIWSYYGFSITKIDIPIVNPSNKVWRDSTQTKTPTSPLHIGDSVRYTNEGHNYMVDMVDLNKNNPDSIKYSIKFLRGKEILVTK